MNYEEIVVELNNCGQQAVAAALDSRISNQAAGDAVARSCWEKFYAHVISDAAGTFDTDAMDVILSEDFVFGRAVAAAILPVVVGEVEP